ncbi:leucine-rich repeat domain-containing protein [Candidatus Lokiarchaeum ossiferum]|uniref:leucine-rich repeat domain-containing protein n=1 Tax=Candidatus Lokiarchaeum ossiferum TaxID=2951803 RepID=UPI00352BD581
MTSSDPIPSDSPKVYYNPPFTFLSRSKRQYLTSFYYEWMESGSKQFFTFKTTPNEQVYLLSIGGKHEMPIPMMEAYIEWLPYYFPHLTYLDIKYDFLEQIPISFQRFRFLQTLDIGGPKLKHIPEEIFPHLTYLETIYLSHAPISQLPNSLGDLTNLIKLEISHCRNLRYLPPSLGNLQNLQKITLQENSICTLPDTLVNCKHLRKVYVAQYDPVASIPLPIGHLITLATSGYNRPDLYAAAKSDRIVRTLFTQIQESGLSSLSEEDFRSLRVHALWTHRELLSDYASDARIVKVLACIDERNSVKIGNKEKLLL